MAPWNILALHHHLDLINCRPYPQFSLYHSFLLPILWLTVELASMILAVTFFMEKMLWALAFMLDSHPYLLLLFQLQLLLLLINVKIHFLSFITPLFLNSKLLQLFSFFFLLFLSLPFHILISFSTLVQQ